MDLAELKRTVTECDPAALLVSQRILRRVLRAEFDVPYLRLRVPHERCYFFDRPVLFRHVEQDELELEPDVALPPVVILLAKPTAEQMQAQGVDDTLSRYWRMLFHVHVHLAMNQREQEGLLTDADVRARIEQIGAAEFDEIRTVLRQEYDLLPNGGDRDVYVEFTAVYLELRHFRNNLRRSYFPAIRDFDVIDRLLAQDVDGEAIFQRTRLKGAPDPVICTDTSSDESNDHYYKLLRQAKAVGKDGDAVRAAILRTKAARVAPPAMAAETRATAMGDLKGLTAALLQAIGLPEEDGPEWLKVLPALLDKADQGRWPVEAKLLYDLQKICHEHKQKLFALDVVGWAMSVGRKPIKRPLNSLQIVHDTNHLRGAALRLTMARISDEDRQRLRHLLTTALEKSEDNLRKRIRPMLIDAFADVGLNANSPPERVALHKMIEELLDRIVENGFFTFSDLRDTLSSNQLKLPDLTAPDAFRRGDPLRRLDQRLATPMEGVYRPAEFYLRWLEGCSSLFFGTEIGRILTRNVLVPFGGAYLLLFALLFLWNHWTGEGLSEHPRPSPLFFVPLGVFFLGLTHFEELRTYLAKSGIFVGRAFQEVLYEAPARLWHQKWLQDSLTSWPFLLLFWYVLKPLGVVAGLSLLWPTTFWSPVAGAVAFIAAAVLLNSRFGAAAGEGLVAAVSLLYSWLRFEALQGLVRVISWFFKQVTEAVESVLYTMDEWLRFRSDESNTSMVLRALMGVFWFPVRYVFRLYFMMLIEPSVNPLKLPLSILAAKFFYLIPNVALLITPFSEAQKDLIEQMTQSIGKYPAVFLTVLVVGPTLWLAPSAVAFIMWEMKGNWRLFRANRSTRLRPVIVGRHGESVLQLLKPGTHSGTIPRLYAHLRRAERGAYRTNNWRAARTYREALNEVRRSVKVFVEREFVTMLLQSHSWNGQPISVAEIDLSGTRIRIKLAHGNYPDAPLWLALEERSGWLIGGIQEVGWLVHVTAEQRQALTSALAGLYILAGVNFVREQLDSALPHTLSGYQVTDRRLVVWTDRRNGEGFAYDLRDYKERLKPVLLNGRTNIAPTQIEARNLVFSRTSLSWDRWVGYWQGDHKGTERPQLFDDSVHLLPNTLA